MLVQMAVTRGINVAWREKHLKLRIILLKARRYIKERVKQTMTKPSCNLFDIWEHSLFNWCSCCCLHPMRGLISLYLDQKESRDCFKQKVVDLLWLFLYTSLYSPHSLEHGGQIRVGRQVKTQGDHGNCHSNLSFKYILAHLTPRSKGGRSGWGDECKHGNITGIVTQIFIGHAKFNISESVSIVLKYQGLMNEWIIATHRVRFSKLGILF